MRAKRQSHTLSKAFELEGLTQWPAEKGSTSFNSKTIKKDTFRNLNNSLKDIIHQNFQHLLKIANEKICLPF